MVKKVIALALVLTGLLGCFSGCGKKEAPELEELPNPSGGSTGDVVGSYVQEELPVPVEGYPQDMVMLPDGRLRVAFQNNDTATLVSTNPERTEWEKPEPMPEEIRSAGKPWSVTLSQWGEMFTVTYTGDGDKEPYAFRFWYQDSAGAVKELELHGSDVDSCKDMMLFAGDFIGEGKLFANIDGAGLREIDLTTGEFSEDKNDQNVGSMHIQCAGDTVYLTGYDSVTFYRDGTISQASDAVQEQISAEQKANEGNSNSRLSFWVNPEGYLFFTTREGLFSSVPGGSVTDQLISGDRSVFGDPSFFAVSLVGTEDKSFYLLGGDAEGSAKLYHYAYDAGAVTQTAAEIRLYMLYGGMGSYQLEDMQKTINQYQIANPQITVNLEVGVDGENGVTEADAIRILNTQILAGSGPDVICLDGLNVDTFLEKDLLVDLSQTLAQVGPTVDVVTGCYGADGKICAVPTAFSIPVIYGPEAEISRIQDLDTLLDAVKAVDSSRFDSAFGCLFPQLTGELFYDSCSAAWFHADGTLNVEQLEEFYDAMYKLFAADADYREKYSDLLAEIAKEGGFEPLPGHFTELGGGKDVCWLGQYFSAGTLDGMESWSFALAGDQNLDGYEVMPLNLQASGVFLPKRILGVLSSSQNQQVAMDFVKFVLDTQVQAESTRAGFPVNRAVLDQQIAEDKVSTSSFGGSGPDGEEMPLDALWPDSTRRQKLNDWINQLTTPASTNWVIRDMILDQMEPCLSGEITPEEAAQAAVKSLNLYLSE